MRSPLRSSRRTARLALVLGTLVGTALPAVAFAGPSDSSSSRPVAVQVGVGPVINIPGGGVSGRVPLDFHYHFRGGDVGPGLGLQLPINFSPGSIGMHIGPTFVWDFRIATAGRAKLYLGPLVSTGYGFSAATHGGGAGHFWFLTLGPQFRALWNDGVGLFIRPASFDMLVGPGWITGNWSFTAGLAVAF
jgi:hypothetical protein